MEAAAAAVESPTMLTITAVEKKQETKEGCKDDIKCFHCFTNYIVYELRRIRRRIKPPPGFETTGGAIRLRYSNRTGIFTVRLVKAIERFESDVAMNQITGE